MKKLIILCVALLMILSIVSCGTLNSSPENTVKNFLKAAEKDDMYTYYSLTEVIDMGKDELKSMVKDMSQKEFHEDMTDYFVWVSGNDSFNCDDGIKRININNMKFTEDGDEYYDVSESLTITTEDGKEYDLIIKTHLWKTNDNKGYCLDY